MVNVWRWQWCKSLFFKWLSPGIFLFILSFFSLHFQENQFKKHRWCGWDLNPWPHDGSCRQYQGAMAATVQTTLTSSQSYKASTIVIYDSDLKIPHTITLDLWIVDKIGHCSDKSLPITLKVYRPQPMANLINILQA